VIPGRDSSPGLGLAVVAGRSFFQAFENVVGPVAGIKLPGLFDLCESCGFAERFSDSALECVSVLNFPGSLHQCLILSEE
jgi:hypothetical protein